MREVPCSVCGEVFVSSRRITCSDDCRYLARCLANEKPRFCEVCGVRYRDSWRGQRTCSRRCGIFLRGLVPKDLKPPPEPTPPKPTVPCAFCGRPAKVKFCSRGCGQMHYVQEQKKHKVCKVCAAPVEYVPGLTPRDFCSVECRAEARKATKKKQAPGERARRRARHTTNGPCELIHSRDLFERDFWTCHICDEAIDPTLPPSDLWSATIDHVVPLVKGGTHTWDNVKAAHRWCNCVKSDGQIPDLGVAS